MQLPYPSTLGGTTGSIGCHPARHLTEHVDAVEVLRRLAQACGHGLLTRAKRHARIVVLLVRLLLALRVANLSLQVVVVFGLVGANAIPEGPLGVGVNVHLDDARLNRIADVLLRRSRTTVEDEEKRQLVVAANLAANVLLRGMQNLRAELDISRSVHAVHISESSRNSEGTALDFAERLVDLVDLIWLGVEARRINVRVVNTILLAASDAKLHLEQAVEL
mmetsp:Transcript_3326/g.6972  ORF Transcript_3326/g.6972 Transcript_3326/m.6972 type:complete len:221 (+) Transcript_3326:278-940(+)